MSDSRLWKDVMKIWPEFLQHIQWIIGDGNTIMFWKDKCINGMQNLISMCSNVQDQMTQRGKDKNHEYLPPNPEFGMDIPCWASDTNGDFTINSAYLIISDQQKASVPVWDMIWKANTIQRNKLLMWRLAHDRLPTRSRMALWSNKSPICLRCESFRESNVHSLRDCRKVASIWNHFINPRDRATFYFLPIKDWLVWKLNNSTQFSAIPWKAKTFMQACTGKDCCTPNIGRRSVSRWSRPCHEWMKINTDGAVCRNTRIAGCGGIVRDEYGSWTLGFEANIGPSTVNGA
ncbi:ribonuclease H [Senna tora]|uniref:Ribonuclease H n=1 Tax=Senna tora TaxID=362788 RepID=A0A834XIU1_9FABA|nr:ribonuclease H [Senna tora]